MSKQSAIELLDGYRGDLSNLLDGLSEANRAAVDATRPRRAFHSRLLEAVFGLIAGSLGSLAKREKLAALWALLCITAGGSVLWKYFKGSSGSLFFDAALPLTVIALLFLVAPTVVFGWFHLIPVLRRAFGSTGADSLAKAVPEVFIAQSNDEVTGKLAGVKVTIKGVHLDLLSHVKGTTSDVTPAAYVQLKVHGGEVVHLLNAQTGHCYTWFHGIKMLEDNFARHAEALRDELRKAGILRALAELATLVGASEPNALAAAPVAFQAKAARVVTSVAATWDDLILNAGFKEELQSVVEMLKNASALRQMGFEPPTSLLLYGPPGTGKTQVARTLATESGLGFIARSANDLKGEYLGQSAPKVRELFSEARKCSPAILFIDEIETVASRRDGGSQESDAFNKDVVAELLVQMDGVIKQDGDIFLMAATNFPDKLDTAILSRFSNRKEIALPDLAARRKMLDVFLDGKPLQDGLGATLDALAAQTDGSSGRDIRALADQAGRRAVARALKGGDVRRAIVTAQDFR